MIKKLDTFIRFQHYCLIASIKRLWKKPITTLVTVTIIGIALCVPTALHIVNKNLQTFTIQHNPTGYITLFFQQKMNEEQAITLIEAIKSNNNFKNVTLTTPEQALTEFKTLSNFEAAIDLLEKNPLPYSAQITLDANMQKSKDIEFILDSLKKIPEISYIQFDKQWLTRFHTVSELLKSISNVITLFVAISVLLIIGNTIRIEIQNRREEIQIKQLLGASNIFIGMPFIYGGIWYGLLSATIATLLLNSASWMLNQPIKDVISAYESNFSATTISPYDSLLLFICGISVAVIGSWIAVTKELSKIQPS